MKTQANIPVAMLLTNWPQAIYRPSVCFVTLFCNSFAIVDMVEGYSDIIFFHVLNERKGRLWVSEKPVN